MDRRNFLKRLGLASAGAVVAYSFPEVIVPKNIEQLLILPEQIPTDFISQLNLITKNEIYPKLIEDCRSKYGEPKEIVLAEKTYEDMMKRLDYKCSFHKIS